MKAILYLFLIGTLTSLTVENLRAERISVQSCDRQIEFDKPPERAISHDINLTEMMLSFRITRSNGRLYWDIWLE